MCAIALLDPPGTTGGAGGVTLTQVTNIVLSIGVNPTNGVTATQVTNIATSIANSVVSTNPITSMNWTANLFSSAFTNNITGRIPIFTNAGIPYYITVGTNANP